MWRDWTPPNAAGSVKRYNSCVKQFGSSSKVRHRIIIQLRISAGRYIPKRTENRYSKHLYMNVHSSTIHNSQKVKTVHMSNNR